MMVTIMMIICPTADNKKTIQLSVSGEKKNFFFFIGGVEMGGLNY